MTFPYHICLVEIRGWNIDHLDEITALLNPEVDDNDTYTTLPGLWPDYSNKPAIGVRLTSALSGAQHAAPLFHDVMNTCLLSHEFRQTLADPNLYLCSDNIRMVLYLDTI